MRKGELAELEGRHIPREETECSRKREVMFINQLLVKVVEAEEKHNSKEQKVESLEGQSYIAHPCTVG
jgi:hypothetical protein